MNVGQFMTQDPCTVDVALSVADAQQRMAQNNIRHLLVVSGDQLVGVVSSRDLAVASSIADPEKTMVEAAMRPSIYVCNVDAPLAMVAHDMEAYRFGCAVVLDEGRAVGIFTTVDALRALRELATQVPTEPIVPPSHRRVESSGGDLLREFRFRVGDALYRAHVNPTAHQGMIR